MSTKESKFMPHEQPILRTDRISSLEIKPILDDAVWAVDIRSLMPPTWKEEIDGVVENHAFQSDLQGGAASTSLAPENYVTSYAVVTGDVIGEKMPWLIDLFRGRIRELVEEVAGEPLVPSENLRAGININTMDKNTQKDGYELHTDSNLWTALGARHTMRGGDGGELVIKRSQEEKDVEIGRVKIQEGHIYIFNGQEHPHQVLILRNAQRRSTVPMNYWRPGEEANRPSDLDGVLYGTSA